MSGDVWADTGDLPPTKQYTINIPIKKKQIPFIEHIGHRKTEQEGKV